MGHQIRKYSEGEPWKCPLPHPFVPVLNFRGILDHNGVIMSICLGINLSKSKAIFMTCCHSKKLDEWQKLTMFTFCGFGWILGYTLIAKISYEKGICLDLIGCHDCKISFSNMTKKLSIIWSIQKLQQLG